MQSEADEWKEYEDKKLDYTNLKIDTLKIDEDGDSNDDDEEINEDGEKVKKSKEGAPWSKLVASDSLDKPSEIEEKSQGTSSNKVLCKADSVHHSHFRTSCQE